MFQEYRLIAKRGNEVIEIESGFYNKEQAESVIPFYETEYEGYKVIVEEY